MLIPAPEVVKCPYSAPIIDDVILLDIVARMVPVVFFLLVLHHFCLTRVSSFKLVP
jgi:hypothetical protein